MRPSTTDPSRWMRRPLHVQDVARAALRVEQQRELAAEQALNNLRRPRDFSRGKVADATKNRMGSYRVLVYGPPIMIPLLSPATYPPGVAPASMARQRISVTASIVFCAAAAGHAIAWNAFCRGAARRGAARRAKPRTRATVHLVASGKRCHERHSRAGSCTRSG